MEQVSICIPTYNSEKTIAETIESCLAQDFKDKEIVVYDDCSTDCTWEIINKYPVKCFRGNVNRGVGAAFTEAVHFAKGKYIVLMCSDDLFTCPEVISDMVEIFKSSPLIGYVTRFYYQFVDGYKGPVRAWRTLNPIVQANNPSGLGFRKEAIKWPFSNKMFIETSDMASKVIADGWDYHIIRYDTIAARVHASTSRQPDYHKKRRVSSPIDDWVGITGKDSPILRDFTSFLQIKNGFSTKAAFDEMVRFVRYRPKNLLYPQFWFYAMVTLLTPKPILRKIPEFYRHRIGRLITREIRRPYDR